MSTLLTPPVQGQIVELRQRRYVVTDVSPSLLSAGGSVAGNYRPENLVSLSSIEDDALGEELQVVWEIETGVRVQEKLSLPNPQEGFDDPRRLDAFLDAVRWGTGSQADTRTLQAPFRSGIDIQDYQLEPLVRAVQMPRANLLIADDVGLGKTIEAGLVCQELILRHRARRILIVCPSSIQLQWRDQMRDKFGLEFRIVDSAMMKELRRSRGLHANPWTSFPRLIVSIDFLKRERPLRLLKEVLPADGQPTYPRRWDLVILDEAHNVAPARSGCYATDSLRTHAVRTLLPHAEHKLFLTATPHNGYPESFSALLELLDNQRFARGVRPDKEQLAAVMVRRLKSELKGWDGAPRFAERKLYPLEVPYTELERQAHQWLQDYTKSRLTHAQDDAESYATEFVLKLLKKRLISCPAAFASTLAQHEQSLRNAVRHRAAARPSVGILRRQVDQVDEEHADDDLYEEATADTVESATRLFRPPSSDEETLLRQLRQWAERAQSTPDSKARTLLAWLRANLKPNGVWAERRVIIFTEYRSTQKWLQTLLTTEGLAEGAADDTRRMLLIYGGMLTEQREKVKAAFQADPAVSPVRILLATDAASEGIDLQNHCARLIHYEIPWNPNRMEQRNGRVDRHGQRESEVKIYHFVGAGYEERMKTAGAQPPGALDADLEFLMRAATKVEAIREDLGKVGPVIALQVEEAMLGRRFRLDTGAAEKSAQPVRQLLRLERRLREQIASFAAQLDETRQEMRFTPEHIQSVVDVGLNLAGKPSLREATLVGVWPDSQGRHKDCPVFWLPPLDGSWAACADGLRHPHTGAIRPITFDHSIAAGRDDVVLAHLGHRLVQMCLRLLRAELWASEGKTGAHLHRVSARLLPNQASDVPVAIAYGRLVVLGGDGARLHEEVITVGGALKDGKLSRLPAGQTQALLGSALPEAASEDMTRRLAALWPGHGASLLSALESRAKEQSQAQQKKLADRGEKEASDIRAILTELANTIRAELDTPEQSQMELELFSDTEKEQWERNVGSLRERLMQIPQEIERETAAVRARFAAPSWRLFPVAVSYLVPERIARQTKEAA